MINLNLERKKLELKKIETALAEMEFKKLERMKEIERIDENIKKQRLTISNIREDIKELENE